MAEPKRGSTYVRMRFASGDEIELGMTADELIPLYDKALSRRKPLRVRMQADGKLCAINPLQVLFFDDQERTSF